MSSGEPPSRFSRRDLLVGGAAIGLGGIGFAGWKVMRQPAARVLAMRVASYDDELVRRVREGIRAFPEVAAKARGGRVVLKPNLVEVHPGRPINTEPRLVAAAAAAFLEEGAASVTVGEGPGHMRDTEAILELTGLEHLLRPLGVPFVDLNTDVAVQVPLVADVTGLGKLPIARTIMQADLVVSMPKMKTHHWAGATLSMKNLFGTVPGSVVGWPKNPLHWAGIPKSIVDLWSTIRPGFAILDGVVAMEGDGPIMGTALDHGLLLFSDNLPALDTTAVGLMGLDASQITYLTRTTSLGGTMSPFRIERAGDIAEARAYKVLPHFDFLRLGS